MYGFTRIIVGIGCGGSIPIAYTRTSGIKDSSQRVSETSSVLLLLQSSSWLLGPILFHVALRLCDRQLLTLQCVLRSFLGVLWR